MNDPRSTRRSRRLLGLLLVISCLAAAATLVAEVERRAEDEVLVGPGEVVPDDLYAAGETIRIQGTVLGDLVAVGREVIVEGTVEGDLLAAAQSITVTGTVGDDARIAGQVLHFGPEARLGDDLVSAGYSLETEPGAVLGGTAIVFGYQALLAGDVGEGVRGALAALELAGPVQGDVEVEVGAAGKAPPMFWPPPVPVPSVRPGLTVADGATIGGDLSYASPDPGEIAAGAEVAGEVTHREVAAPGEEEPSVTDRLLDALRRVAALLLVGGLLLLVAPSWTAGLADAVRARPLPALGWGVVFLAASLVAALVLALVIALLASVLGAATLGGLAVAAVGGGVLAELALVIGVILACAYLAPVVAALAGGRLALAWGASPAGTPGRGRSFAALALGVLVLVLLGLVPILGRLVGVLVLLLGLGALWLWVLGHLRRRPAGSV
jgi:cytoskeletal protein CcmA (bactofilin family)